MRKPTRKLAVRREILRVLAATDLTRAAGGEVAAMAESGKELCTAIAVLPAKP